MEVIFGRRGLSQVIASVLMILLVLVLAAIIFLWARGFIGEQVEKFGKPVDEYCEAVDFSVFVVENGGYHILEIVNRGNVGISAFEVKMYSGGNSEIFGLDVGVPVGESISAEVSLGVMQNGELPERIDIFPVLLGEIRGVPSKNLFTCMDNPVPLLNF